VSYISSWLQNNLASASRQFTIIQVTASLNEQARKVRELLRIKVESTERRSILEGEKITKC